MSKKDLKLDHTYFHERLDPLGWTPDRNVLTLPASVSGDRQEHHFKLFEADEAGNLVINYYHLSGAKATYSRGDGPQKHYQVLRLRVPTVRADGSVAKYKHPSGAGTLPWFCPSLIDAYNTGKELDTIVFVEGVLKAYTGWVNGVPTIGLPGIHNTKDRSAGTLHADVITALKAVKPRNVVFLHDGDCRRLTRKWPENPEVDLYTRPNSFFTSARNMGVLLQDYARMVGFRSWYMHVVSESVNVPPGMEAPKGLDDLFLANAAAKVAEHRRPILPDPKAKAEREPAELGTLNKKEKSIYADALKEVAEDLQQFSAPNRYFERRDLDRPDRLREYWHLRSADQFYSHYQELIGDREFTYDGTKYQWSEEDKGLKVKVPAVAKRYVRVGTDYFKYIRQRNPHNNALEEKIVTWTKGAIVDDNGKHFVGHIERFDAWTNWPDHVAHRRVMDSCLNAYHPFPHTPDPDPDCPPPEHTLMFMRHIFGTGAVEVPHPKKPGQTIRVTELDLGLDYLKLLYEKPTQLLPIVCLVSKDRETGKSTFFQYLREFFGQNSIEIGAKDLENDFNAHYASKLVVVIDEALVSKQESVEKMKHLSTAKYITVNGKNVAQYEQPFFGKFLLGSNNIRNFIKTDEDEVRFWVRKVPAIPKDQKKQDLLDLMVDEIPAMLNYLRRRPMATERLSRSWFEHSLLVTDALVDVRKHSAPTALRTIKAEIAGLFHACREKLETIKVPTYDAEGKPNGTREEHVLYMSTKDVKQEMFRGTREDDNYIRRLLKEELGLQTYMRDGKPATTSYSYWRITEKRTTGQSGVLESVQDLEEVKVRVPGRPFMFLRSQFVPDDVWEATDPAKQPTANGKPPAHVGAAVAVGDAEDLPF